MKKRILFLNFFLIFSTTFHNLQSKIIDNMSFGLDLEIGKYARTPFVDEYIHTYALGGGIYYEHKFFSYFFGVRPNISGSVLKAEDYSSSFYEGLLLGGIDFMLYPFIQSFNFSNLSILLGINLENYFSQGRISSYPSLSAGIQYETSIGVYLGLKYYNGLNFNSYKKNKQRFVTSFINFCFGYNIASIFYTK